MNADGTFFVTDQEGFWLPKNRINWVKPGTFHGNMWGYHEVTDTSDAAMEPPVCWITNSFDRSPGEIVRVTGNGWGPLEGSLLNLSYGNGKIFIVLGEKLGEKMQGGMATLPIPQFPTGVMRGRFHPGDGQLYACGMYAWAGNQTQPGGFYRVRYTGKPIYVPVGLRAGRDGIAITFTGALDRNASSQVNRYSVRIWGLKRTENYGSDHIGERPILVRSATLSPDGRTVRLAIPNLAPTWCMAITYAIRAVDGSEVAGEIDNTIHQLERWQPCRCERLALSRAGEGMSHRAIRRAAESSGFRGSECFLEALQADDRRLAGHVLADVRRGPSRARGPVGEQSDFACERRGLLGSCRGDDAMGPERVSDRLQDGAFSPDLESPRSRRIL